MNKSTSYMNHINEHVHILEIKTFTFFKFLSGRTLPIRRSSELSPPPPKAPSALHADKVGEQRAAGGGGGGTDGRMDGRTDGRVLGRYGKKLPNHLKFAPDEKGILQLKLTTSLWLYDLKDMLKYSEADSSDSIKSPHAQKFAWVTNGLRVGRRKQCHKTHLFLRLSAGVQET